MQPESSSVAFEPMPLSQMTNREQLRELYLYRFREAYSQRHTYPEARERARYWVAELRNFARNDPAEKMRRLLDPRTAEYAASQAAVREALAEVDAERTWRDSLSLGNLMRFGAFWVVLGAIVRLLSSHLEHKRGGQDPPWPRPP